jgi:non-canonical purine NTP pyrophosphatase (RdgB/HAM1 family)
METILFATGNDRKLGEAKLACDIFGIVVKQIKLDIDEIQSHDPLVISRHKADQAFNLVNEPVVVTDTSWNFPALKGFPGGYMKDVAGWFSEENFLNLMRGEKDRRVSFTETVIYKDASQTKVFSKEFWGVVVDEPRGGGSSLENVVEFEGHTLGERRDQGGFSHKAEDYVWHEFASWFSKKEEHEHATAKRTV